jgi:hypothetical protein
MSSVSKNREAGRLGCLMAILMLCAAQAAAAPMEEPERRNEIRVTIGFLLNFAKFTQWPERAPQAPKEFRIGLLGDDLLAETMQRLTSGLTVRGLPVSVVKARTSEELRKCQIAFFGSEVRRLSGQVAVLKNLPVLTVSTEEGFLGHGGMIELFIQDNRMRFAINRSAVDSSNLRISVELQELATPR